MTTQVNQPVTFDKLTGAQLVHVYNQLVGDKSKVKKFRDLGTGRARVNQALDDLGLSGPNIVTGPDGAPRVLTRADAAKATEKNGQDDPLHVPGHMRKPIPTPEEEAENKRQALAERNKAAVKDRRKDKKTHAKARKRSYLKQTGVSKKDKVLQMITRKGGATATEMVEETKWLPHTLRAQITRHRQAGHKIVAQRKDGVTTYRIGE